MTDITTAPAARTRHRGPRRSLRIDMTPMVDLGFLLITFFIFTATMAENKALKLFMPADGKPTGLGESAALTLLLGSDNKVYVYSGQWTAALQQQKITETNYNVYTGTGAFIRARQQAMGQKKDDLMLLIKPTPEATYKNIIAALDEATINAVRRYAIVEPTKEETAYVNKQ